MIPCWAVIRDSMCISCSSSECDASSKMGTRSKAGKVVRDACPLGCRIGERSVYTSLICGHGSSKMEDKIMAEMQRWPRE